MKIVLLNGSDPWNQASGYCLYSARMADLLSADNDVCSISVFRPATDRLVAPANIRRISYTTRRRSLQWQRMRSVIGSRSFCEREFSHPGLIEWTQEMLRRESPDLVIFNHIRAGWLATRLRRTWGRSVYVAHNAESEAYASIAKLEANPLGSWFASIEARKLAILERRIMGAVDAAVTLSSEDRSRLEPLNPHVPIQVVPPVFDVPSPAEAYPGRRCTLLLVGSFFWRPKRNNARWLLERVYKPLKLRYPGLGLTIVGTNAGSLRAHAKAVEGVTIHADVPSVEPYFRSPAIFVTPERQVGGVKLKTCEAAAFGQTIVSTRQGIEGTGLKDEDSCLVADSESDFQTAIVRCMDDGGLACKLAQGARKTALAEYSRPAVESKLAKALALVAG